jgi:hypothetical protein
MYSKNSRWVNVRALSSPGIEQAFGEVEVE